MVRRLGRWLGMFATSVLVSILFAALMPSAEGEWRFRVEVGRNVVIVTTVYLLPPFLLARLMNWRARSAHSGAKPRSTATAKRQAIHKDLPTCITSGQTARPM